MAQAGVLGGRGGGLRQSRLQGEFNERLELEPLPDLRRPQTAGQRRLALALAKVCAANLAELKHTLRLAIQRLRRKPALIRAGFVAAKLN